ncbi:MAG: sugar phosphate isomerase/epimerase [candidate division WOR-3 bacterium]
MHLAELLRPRLGVQVLFDFADATEAVAFAAAHRLAVLELNLGNVHFLQQLASARERTRIRAACRQHNVAMALHAWEGPSFFITNERVRRCGVTELKRLLNQAADIGVANVVMHLGHDMNYGTSTGTGFTHQQYPDYYRSMLTELLLELKDHAGRTTRLCVENVGGFRYNLTFRVLDQVLGGSLGLCLDIGHLNTLPQAPQARELAFFKKHRTLVFHSHVHDNSGKRDEHQVLGRGNIDFMPFFRLLARTSALVVFEVRPREAALQCLSYYKHRIEPTLSRLRARSARNSGTAAKTKA